jgi:hypothetical protein
MHRTEGLPSIITEEPIVRKYMSSRHSSSGNKRAHNKGIEARPSPIRPIRFANGAELDLRFVIHRGHRRCDRRSSARPRVAGQRNSERLRRALAAVDADTGD